MLRPPITAWVCLVILTALLAVMRRMVGVDVGPEGEGRRVGPA